MDSKLFLLPRSTSCYTLIKEDTCSIAVPKYVVKFSRRISKILDSSASSPDFQQQLVYRLRVLPVGETEYDWYDGHAANSSARKDDIEGRPSLPSFSK